MPCKDVPERTVVTEIQIRRFRRADLRQILEIESAAFRDQAYTKEMFIRLYRHCADLFFVTRRSGRIVGYAVTCAESGRAEIVSIAIDPGHRRLGIGRLLMQHTLRRLKALGVRKVHLAVRSTNTAGIRFYRTLGFSRTRKIARYYEDGGDAFLMKKEVL